MIYKSKNLLQKQFTQLPNDLINEITNTTALAILVYLLSKPDDWVTYKQQIYKHFDDGRERIDKAWKWLENEGYIVGTQKIDAHTKKFNGYEWIVYDTNFKNRGDEQTPIVGKPIVGKPIVGKQATTNTNNTNTNNTNIEYTNKNTNVFYQPFVGVWFEHWPDYVFSKTDGAKVKSIIKQMQKICVGNKITPPAVSEVVDAWRVVLQNLPPFYRDKDLKTIDSKLNEIIKQIKQTNHGINNNNEQRATGAI